MVDVGKNHIDGWSRLRKLENHRVCEVEQALLDNLKSSYDSMKSLAQRKTRDYDHTGTQRQRPGQRQRRILENYRHANEDRAAHDRSS